jgi:hypothetical protein
MGKLHYKILRGDDGCWIWQGATMHDAIPAVDVDGRKRIVRRELWEREAGPIPPRRKLIRTCNGGSLCVRPDHHTLRRQTAAKLDEEDVREIKRRLDRMERPDRIAVDFPVHASAVYYIARGDLWKEVEP